MFIGTYIIVIVEEKNTKLMSFDNLLHFLWGQHVSDINMPITGACDYSVELSHWSHCSWFDVC